MGPFRVGRWRLAGRAMAAGKLQWIDAVEAGASRLRKTGRNDLEDSQISREARDQAAPTMARLQAHRRQSQFALRYHEKPMPAQCRTEAWLPGAPNDRIRGDQRVLCSGPLPRRDNSKASTS